MWLPITLRLLAIVKILTISHCRHYIGFLTSDFVIKAIFSELMDVMASHNSQIVSNRKYTHCIGIVTLSIADRTVSAQVLNTAGDGGS